MVNILRYALAFFLFCFGLLILVFAADYAYGRYVIYTQIVPAAVRDYHMLEQDLSKLRPVDE